MSHAEAEALADGPEADGEPVDGRRAWRDRNRLAVVDALLDLYAEGNLKPGAQEVAKRSGVSRRSVFRYFEDLDDLDRAAIQRQQERVIHLIELQGIGEGSLDARIGQMARQRVALWEAVQPAARVSRLRAPFHHVIAEELAESRRFLSRQIERQFAPELNAMAHTARTRVSAAADVLCSFEAFDLLSTGRGMAPAEIRATIAAALIALFASPNS